MVKTASHKKHRRLRKRIRETLGTLFLVSAIVIAAIPADNLRAEGTGPTGTKVTLTPQESGVPMVPDSQTIYTTGDGRFQFAYMQPAGGGNEIAVILGTEKRGYLQGEKLTIPDKVAAYRNYRINEGTGTGYVAVSKSNEFLYYKVDEPILDAQGKPTYNEIKDENGNVIEKIPLTQPRFYPCYYDMRSKWENLDLGEFYYVANNQLVSSGDAQHYIQTRDPNHQWIYGIDVAYIGNQYLKQDETTKEWSVAGEITQISQGIFSEIGNLSHLTVGDTLRGIGNYAFAGCSGFTGITLSNALDTIGNYAFMDCVNMTEANIPLKNNLMKIGERAFYNCRSLQKFTVPISVRAIGDSAFENCSGLTWVELCGFDGTKYNEVLLTELGYNVFRGCQNLEGVKLPQFYAEAGDSAVDISMFEGCYSLKYISMGSKFSGLKEGLNASFGFEEFKSQVAPEFYLEGYDDSTIHEVAKNNSIAFSYLDREGVKEGRYEILITEGGKTAVYQVQQKADGNDELILCEIPKGMSEVKLPENIGPCHITKIENFQHNCYLEKIYIPSSIRTIAADAFRGCHNLKAVIFNEPVNIENIGDNAFQTQETDGIHKADCPTSSMEYTPELSFVGPVSSVSAPFRYAMNPGNNITHGNQVPTYIQYYSGWPTNLKIQYNDVTDKNELIDYCTLNDLKNAGTGGSSRAGNGIASWPYMTEEYKTAATEAFEQYKNDKSQLTGYQRQILDGALNIVIPEGVTGIRNGLFGKEADDTAASLGLSQEDMAKTLTANSLQEIEAESFNGFTNLRSASINGITEKIGNYAFRNCENLEEASLAPTVAAMGLRPFAGCTKLGSVDFQGGKQFVCENSIIYGLEEGKKTSIVECLESRSGVVESTELEGLKSIAPEAFMETNVGSVDFKSTSITELPDSAFERTTKLFSVYLPDSCFSVGTNAFKDSTVTYLEMPNGVGYIDNSAFEGVSAENVTFYCVDESYAYKYAKSKGFKTTSKPLEVYYTVTFWDWDRTLLATQKVLAGSDAEPPEVKGRDGYKHVGWVPDYKNITGDTAVTAQYDAIDPDSLKHTVIFVDHDDKELKKVLVADGEKAEPPVDPAREGYLFTGWRPSLAPIKADTTFYAMYEKLDSTANQFTVRFIDEDQTTVLFVQKVNPGESPFDYQPPAKEGYKFTGWVPSVKNVTKDTDTYARYEKVDGSGSGGDNGNGNGSDNGSNNGNGNNNGNNNSNGNGTTTSKLYTVTVKNGSGSGSYVAGATVYAIANDPAEGQEFKEWTIDPSDLKIASKVMGATLFTMPEKDVTLTASYQAKGTGTTTGSANTSTNQSSGSGSKGTGTGTGSGGTVTKPSGNGQTTVVIDKNGLSNTDVISANVNGSSDNFVIKITESAEASEQVLKALVNEYGDVANIKYFPMDISLYDSTGKTRITDTKGLSIDITLPLPDSLITYAGNNKAAGVVDEKLDKLSVKFSTIDGVSCITFRAEHFSPYVVYADTANLTAGTIADNTPKTGDGIHPKWFLSIGLACISMVLFLKRDRRTARVRRAAA